MPVWHVSVSVWTAGGSRPRDDERAAEREAIRLLGGVGGDVEWWVWDLPIVGKVGHLRVPLTREEYELVPPGCATVDAGETGPMRPRTLVGVKGSGA